MFKDRFEAGKLLAEKLQHYKNQNAVVVAIPRGGMETGYVVARELNLPLEVVLSKKLGHPRQKEYAIGAVSLESRIVTDVSGVTREYIETETDRIRELLRERYRFYYRDRRPLNLQDRIIIVVDDGIATGNTLLSTIELLRKSRPRRIVIAVPVSSRRALQKLGAVADEIVCLLAPEDFFAVGEFYGEFRQVSDEEVVEWLERARRPAEEATSNNNLA